jgi:hypothetical protein
LRGNCNKPMTWSEWWGQRGRRRRDCNTRQRVCGALTGTTGSVERGPRALGPPSWIQPNPTQPKMWGPPSGKRRSGPVSTEREREVILLRFVAASLHLRPQATRPIERRVSLKRRASMAQSRPLQAVVRPLHRLAHRRGWMIRGHCRPKYSQWGEREIVARPSSPNVKCSPSHLRPKGMMR